MGLSTLRFARPHILGVSPDMLQILDEAVEIPVYGLPYSYNVATATAMALYEYCRQYPRG